ncbi:MAG: acetyl-CoA synthase subunit gamma [Clostridia bacterium]|nr:acetyl-CoA synthase subunit gamma [Clostridia bacterium]
MDGKQIKLPMIDDHQTAVCCLGEQAAATFEDAAGANWVTGQLETVVGPIYQVSTALDHQDRTGSAKARWGIGRMNYAIPPALYAIGEPDKTSPVLVSANYKLSFDLLRRELTGLNLWVLVIDTKGINVWCAAGKGSFGTAELVRMVVCTRLSELVSDHTLILPQLAAPGVSAHEVRRHCGFKIVYGPVRAADIPAFLSAGCKAEASMRQTHFTLRDRLILAPVELVGMIKPLIGLTAFLFLLNLVAMLFGRNLVSLNFLVGQTLFDLIPFLIAILVGVILVPALLPYIPGRALAWKGWVLGIFWALGYSLLTVSNTGWLQSAAYFLIIPAITAFIGMNFTGSTTYTSLSGVIKEMGIALPLIIVSASLGLIALITAYFV